MSKAPNPRRAEGHHRKFHPCGYGWTANIPGFGLLADQFKDPALHVWSYDTATMAPSAFGPGGRVPLEALHRHDRRGAGGARPAFRGAAAPRRRQYGYPRSHRRRHALSACRGRGRAVLVGDTHAAQGDGEVCGTAIESQMNVELTLDLVKGANLKTPRFTTTEPVTRHLDGAGYEVTRPASAPT